MHYVYILRRKDEDWYIGYTDDIERRMKEHQNKYSCELIYYEAYKIAESARKRERKLKHYGSAWRAIKNRIKA